MRVWQCLFIKPFNRFKSRKTLSYSITTIKGLAREKLQKLLERAKYIAIQQTTVGHLAQIKVSLACLLILGKEKKTFPYSNQEYWKLFPFLEMKLLIV